jgi:hypothetical protein
MTIRNLLNKLNISHFILLVLALIIINILLIYFTNIWYKVISLIVYYIFITCVVLHCVYYNDQKNK